MNELNKIDKETPHEIRMSGKTYTQFIEFQEISDKYLFLTSFKNMVKKLEAESDQLIKLRQRIEQLEDVNEHYLAELELLELKRFDTIRPLDFQLSRKYHNLSLRQISEKTGLSISTISRFENGTDNISLNNYLAIREFYMTIIIDK